MTEQQSRLFTGQLHQRMKMMSGDRERMAYLVRLLWHEEYVWGGESVTGADCSGSIAFAGYLLGYNLRVTADSYDKNFTDDLRGEVPVAGDVCIWYEPGTTKAKHIAMFSDHLLIMDADRRFLDTPVYNEIIDRPGQAFVFKRLDIKKMRAASKVGDHAHGIDEDIAKLFGMFQCQPW